MIVEVTFKHVWTGEWYILADGEKIGVITQTAELGWMWRLDTERGFTELPDGSFGAIRDEIIRRDRKVINALLANE